jgi:DNA-binding transcriptional LysR family regulator
VQKLSLRGLPPPSSGQEACNNTSVLAMVEAGFGVALLPESCLKDRNSGIEFRPVSAVLPAVEIMAVWKSAKRPPLLDHISFDPEKFSLKLI